jgi:hypothetical protein
METDQVGDIGGKRDNQKEQTKLGPTDNLNTTQTPECSKGKYNVKIRKQKSLLRSHQQPT